MKTKRPFLLATIAAILALFLAWGFLQVKEARLNAVNEPSPVVIAIKDIFQGVRLEESQLEIIKVPRKFLQPGAVSSPTSVLGMVSQAPILKGEQILETKLVPLSKASGLSMGIPQGYRALSIEVDDASGVSGLVRPNNFVDLLTTFEMEDSSDTAQVATYTIAQKVLVLAVGEDLGMTLEPENRTRGASKKNILGGQAFAEAITSQHKKTVTLALTPRQVQTVEFAKEQGKISLSLRPQREEEPLDLTPATALDVVGFKGHLRRSYHEYRGR